MPKIKTHQSIAKRFKISKTGKLMKKKAGQDHFNARERGSVTRAKRRPQQTSDRVARPLKHLIPYSN
ncbi:MAG: 50S ribosomal protein L35 [Candidatus Parcubacteria bacterium]|nr:50S ribosomal protein L35 [Candidatus Parcubacteria bacterium]